MLNHCRNNDMINARAVVGRGGDGPLCDPGSRLVLGGRARRVVRG